jgi:hypothetical protein
MPETFERVKEPRGKVEVPVRQLYRRAVPEAGGDWRQEKRTAGRYAVACRVDTAITAGSDT